MMQRMDQPSHQRNIHLLIAPVLHLNNYLDCDLCMITQSIKGHHALTTVPTRDLVRCARGEAKHTVKQGEVCARTRSGCASTACSCGGFVRRPPGPSSDPRASGHRR